MPQGHEQVDPNLGGADSPWEPLKSGFLGLSLEEESKQPPCVLLAEKGSL